MKWGRPKWLCACPLFLLSFSLSFFYTFVLSSRRIDSPLKTFLWLLIKPGCMCLYCVSVCACVEPSQYSNIRLLFTPGRVGKRRGEGYVWWGVGHCIYSRQVYMWRGGGCKEGGRVRPARGLLGDSVVYQAPLRLKWGGVGGESGLQTSKTRAYDLPRPLTMTAPFLISPHFHTSCL